MEYAQLNESGTEALQITSHGNIEWDAKHFCPASALTEDEAALFRVVPLSITEAPAFDPMTQTIIRDGCEQVDGAWQYKWRIDALTPEQIEAKRKEAVPQSVSPRQIREALIDSNLIDAVEAALAAGDRKLKNWYEFSTEFQRSNPHVIGMGLALGVTEVQLDDLWTLASTL